MVPSFFSTAVGGLFIQGWHDLSKQWTQWTVSRWAKNGWLWWEFRWTAPLKDTLKTSFEILNIQWRAHPDVNHHSLSQLFSGKGGKNLVYWSLTWVSWHILTIMVRFELNHTKPIFRKFWHVWNSTAKHDNDSTNDQPQSEPICNTWIELISQ